jgi:hypothetical protein
MRGSVMPHDPKPISLSDSELSAVMAAAAPLHPYDRSAFLASLAARLRHEPEVGPGTVNRVIRELLATKQYRRQDALAVGGAAPGAPTRIGSPLLVGPGIEKRAGGLPWALSYCRALQRRSGSRVDSS